jgi:iron complex outermembrane receptor protein
MSLEVTSVSKREEKISQVAAAIFVITQNDIRTSGAANIPDLLRMVPGMEVAQINASTWAISARGFNLQFANKLLVLIDGRPVYTPLFGGVNWDVQDVPLDDIEQIEVIRGPGGAVWGANAMNGVINIITKKASQTPGTLVTASAGTGTAGSGTIRYGGNAKGKTDYRVFAKYLTRGQFPDPSGQDGEDDWHLAHGGFREDTELSSRDSLTTEGDVYTGREGAIIVHSTFTPPDNINEKQVASIWGGNIQSRWDHVFSKRSDTTVQISFEKFQRYGPEADEGRNTVDVDFQHHVAWGERQDIIWGLGYRYTADHTVGTIDQTFLPPDDADWLFNALVQDQISLKPKRVLLSIGTKLEESHFAGAQLLPSARLAWTPGNRSTVWVAISRANRAPTRRDRGLSAVVAALPGPAEVVLLGNPDFKSEHVIAYEAGYRAQASRSVSLDAAMFFNVYSGLESAEPQPPVFDADAVPPLLDHPRILENRIHGTTEGIEGFLNWRVTSRWTLAPGYSFLKMHLHTDAGSLDTTTVADMQGSSPVHQAQLRSHLELGRGFAWDAGAYFVSNLPAGLVASHTRLDTQLTWRFAERARLSVVGQNLLHDHNEEFSNQLQSVNSSQVKRSGYVKFTWQF